MRVSFKPGEITPEDAQKLCTDMVMRWTKGKHQMTWLGNTFLATAEEMDTELVANI